jgi:hypothetical protein
LRSERSERLETTGPQTVRTSAGRDVVRAVGDRVEIVAEQPGVRVHAATAMRSSGQDTIEVAAELWRVDASVA